MVFDSGVLTTVMPFWVDIYDKFLFQDFFGFFSYVGSNENSEHNDFLL